MKTTNMNDNDDKDEYEKQYDEYHICRQKLNSKNGF